MRRRWRWSVPILTALVWCLGVEAPSALAGRVQATPAYYLLVYTDIGPDSTTVPAIQAGMTGMAWIELREIVRISGQKSCTVDTCPIVDDTSTGFVPTDSSIFETPGRLADEANHPWSWRIAFPLSQSQYESTQQFVDSVSLPDYGLDVSDCPNGDCSPAFHNFGNSVPGLLLPTNCMGFVQAVVDKALAKSGAGPVDLDPPDPSSSPTGIDPLQLYEALTFAGNGGGLQGGKVTANPQPLDYSTQQPEAPDACSADNLELAALANAQDLAASLGLSYQQIDGGPTLPLGGSGPNGDQPPFTGGFSLYNASLQAFGDPSRADEVLQFAGWGDGPDSNSVLDPHGPTYTCGTDQFGNPAYCSGHSYDSEGPFTVRWFMFGYGNALDEYDSTWQYDPTNTNTWDPDYVAPSGGVPYCAPPAVLQASVAPLQQFQKVCAASAFRMTAKGVLQYLPKPARSARYFTVTLTLDPSKVTKQVAVESTNSTVSLEAGIGYRLGYLMAPIYPTPPATSKGLNCSWWGAPIVVCQAPNGAPLQGDSNHQLRIAILTSKPCPACQFRATAVGNSGVVGTARAQGETGILTKSNPDYYPAKAARDQALDQLISALDTTQKITDPVSQLKEAAGQGEKIGVTQALEEVIGEAGAKVVGGVALLGTGSGLSKEYLEQLRKDPPREDYTTITPPTALPLPRLALPNHPAETQTLQGWLTLHEQLVGDLRAGVLAYERAQGARTAHANAWVLKQMSAYAADMADASRLAERDATLSGQAATALHAAGIGTQPVSAGALADLKRVFTAAYQDGKLREGVIAYYDGLGIPSSEAGQLPAIAASELDSAQPTPLFDGLGDQAYASADRFLCQLLAAESFQATNDPYGSLPPA